MAETRKQQSPGSGLAILVVGALLVGVGAYAATRIWGVEPEAVVGVDDVVPDMSGNDSESVHRERAVMARMAVAPSQVQSLAVVDQDGVPIPDVLVGMRSRWSTRSVTGITDESGRLDLPMSGSKSVPVLELYTDRTGSVVAREMKGESGVYSLTLPQSLTVRVVNEHDAALPGAEVWALTTGPVEVCRRLGVADAEGRLLTRGIGGGVSLRAELEGVGAGKWTRVKPGEATLTIGSRSRTVVVEVQNEAGEALEGAIVRASGQDANWSDVCGTRDDGRGFIRYGGPLPLEGQQAKLIVEVAGYAPGEVLLAFTPELPRVVCKRGHDVRFLIGAKGEALSGASVAWHGCVRRIADSDEDGYCELSDLPIGVAGFSVSYSGATEERSFPVREGSTQYVWNLKETESLGGRVAVAGKPVVGWTIELADWLTDDVRSVQSDALGGFLFLDCPSAAGYEVIVREPRRNVSVWRRRCAPGERLDIALPASTLDLGSISGVFRGPEGEPVEADVIIESTSGDLRLVQVSRGGVFAFEGLPSGDYVIGAVPPGWSTPLVVTRSLYPGQVESVELRGTAPSAVAVEVTEGPELLDHLVVALWFDGAWRSLPKTGATRWEMSGVAPGEHLLRVFGMAPTIAAVTLKAGEAETVRFNHRPAQHTEVLLSGSGKLDLHADVQVYFVEGKCEVRGRRIGGATTWRAPLRNDTRYAVEVRASERVLALGEVFVPAAYDENAVLLESFVVEAGW